MRINDLLWLIFPLFFDKTEKYEQMLDKDLCDWSVDNIISFYKSLSSPSVDFLLNINSQYRQYAAWCHQENLIKDNMNHFLEVDRVTILNCVNRALAESRVITRQQLLKTILMVVNPVDQYVILACFEGIGGKRLEELINLKLSDFNEDGYVYLCSGRKIKYSEELLKYARRSAAENYYYVDTEGTRKKFELIGNGDIIVKKLISQLKQDDSVREQSVYRRLKKISILTNLPVFTTKALKESGRIEYIKEVMRKEHCSPLEAFSKDSNVIYIYGDINSRIAYVEKYKQYFQL